MYWVSRKIMTEVMPNPYNNAEKMKKGKANQVFSDIQKSYLNKYVNTWDTTVVPLDFFATEYALRSGQSKETIIDLFEKYYKVREDRLYGIEQVKDTSN